jgi:hypothetical protein
MNKDDALALAKKIKEDYQRKTMNNIKKYYVDKKGLIVDVKV